MKRILLALVLSGCSFVNGNGHIVHEDRTVPAFRAVAVSDDFKGSIVIGPTAVALDLDDNVIRDVRTIVSGTTLSIGPAPGMDVDPSEAASFTVSSPAIDGVHLSGAAKVTATANMPVVDVATDGASHLDLSATSDVVSIGASGDSTVKLAGQANVVDVDASGASTVTSDVLSSDANVTASGGAHVTVHASTHVLVHASGGARVVVIGHPTARTLDVTGGASVSFE